MRQFKILYIFLLTLQLFLPTLLAAASSSSTHSIVQERFNSGGTIASIPEFTSIHHVGQPVVGRLTSTTHQVNVGFLHNLILTFIQLGDINGDGAVDLKDIITGLHVLAGKNPAGTTHAGDVNSDNRIGLEEVLHDLEQVSQ